MREAGRRRQAGHVGLWVVILVGLLALCGLVVSALDPDLQVPAWWIVGCAMLVAGGLATLARRDLYEFCRGAGALALMGTGVCGLGLMVLGEETPWLVATTVALAVVASILLVSQYRLGHAEELLPNALAERFDNDSLMELSGVQFGVTHSDLRVPAGGELVVALHAQNGMDADRTLELRLEPRADIGKGGHLAFDKVAVLELPAGAAGVVTVPVAVHPKARGTYVIAVEPKVKGGGGRRLRVFRARPFSHRVSGGMQVVGLFAGIFVWGGGMTLELKVAKNRDWKTMPVEEPSPAETKLFYRPDRALLEGIRNRL